MANIFISYSSTDKSIVERLANILEEKGWTVWWDRDILIGDHFDETIENELDKADCALVIWTSKSVSSNWVRAEASEAAKQDKLIPILLEEVEIPLAFRNMESALLYQWKGDETHPEFKLLLEAIRTRISIKKNIAPQPFDPNKETTATDDKPIHTPKSPNHLIRNLLIVFICLLGLGFVAFGLMKKYSHPVPENRITIIGKVKTAAEMPIQGAEVNVEGTKHFAISTTDGTYKLVLDDFLPGEEITISTSHPQFEDKFFFFLPKDKKIDLDIYLNPITPQSP